MDRENFLGAGEIPISTEKFSWCRTALFEDLKRVKELLEILNPRDPKLADEVCIPTWRQFIGSPFLMMILVEPPNLPISSCCTLAITPNLTRGLRPFATIENVVTHPDCRKQRYGTLLLDYACHVAWNNNCYKVSLTTGTRSEATLNFYEKAGFKPDAKVAFVTYPEDVDLPPLSLSSS